MPFPPRGASVKTARVTRNVDAESTKPRLSTKKKTPSIKAVSDSESDSEVDELLEDLSIQEIDNSVRNPIPDKQRTDKKKSKPTRPRTSRLQPPVVSSTRPEDDNDAEDFLGNENQASRMIVTSAVHIPLLSVRHPSISTFIPNCLFMFVILHDMHNAVSENSYLYKICPEYNTILTRAYYSILWFIQIFRAKTLVGNITGAESSFLRRFERMFPFESLPIAGPLVTYFENLSAIKVDDPMYNWICPTIPSPIGPDTAGNTTTSNVHSSRPLFPWFPAIIELFHKVRTSANPSTSVDSSAQFIPFSLANGGLFAGVTFPPVTNANPLPNPHRDMLQYLGINFAPEQLPDTFQEYQSSYRRIDNIPTVAAQTPLASIDKFLLMDTDMSWFSILVSMATSEASFFKGTKKFSDIASVTGLSTLVSGTMPDLTGSPTRPSDWYPSLHRDNKASYSTTCGATSDMDFYVGVTNSILLSYPSNHPSFPDSGSIASGHRTGPFFQNTLVQRETPSHVTVSPLFLQNIRLHYYVPNGGLSTV